MRPKDVFSVSLWTPLGFDPADPPVLLGDYSGRYFIVARNPPPRRVFWSWWSIQHLIIHQVTLRITEVNPTNDYFASLLVVTANGDAAQAIGIFQSLTFPPQELRPDFGHGPIETRDFTFVPPLDLTVEEGRATQIVNPPGHPPFGNLSGLIELPLATGGKAAPRVGDVVLGVFKYGDEGTPHTNPTGNVYAQCGVRYSVGSSRLWRPPPFDQEFDRSPTTATG